MNLDAVFEMARRGRLYPSVILYGSSFEERRDAALDTARVLLCNAAADKRPCGRCRHCRRVSWPEKNQKKFHPDFHVLERDLRTATSVDATKKLLQRTLATPFEARGQVYVIAEAGSLSAGAADSLLKTLEEPPEKTPRHFLLLAGSRLGLLPTLRSRSLSIFLGGAQALDNELVEEIHEAFANAIDAYLATGATVLLLTAADALGAAPGWEDARAREPWATAAAAVLRYARGADKPQPLRRALFALAQELHDAWRLRLRAIAASRILEGLVSRHLADVAAAGR